MGADAALLTHRCARECLTLQAALKLQPFSEYSLRHRTPAALLPLAARNMHMALQRPRWKSEPNEAQLILESEEKAAFFRRATASGSQPVSLNGNHSMDSQILCRTGLRWHNSWDHCSTFASGSPRTDSSCQSCTAAGDQWVASFRCNPYPWCCRTFQCQESA